MKARTKFQKHVEKLHKSIPELSNYQYNEAIKKAALHIAKRNSKGVFTCLDCGHEWKSDSKEKFITCPHCSSRLEVSTDRKRVFTDWNYFMVITTCDGFQVLRTYLIKTALCKGEKPQHFIAEVFQRWMAPGKKDTIIGLQRTPMNMYSIHSWCFCSEFEIRKESYIHVMPPSVVIGKTRMIPELKRNGFNGNFHGCNPSDLFDGLLNNNKIETLWKAGQYNIVNRALFRSCQEINKYWNSIKIAIRHNYMVNDYYQWIDMIYFLDNLGKDIRNPKHVCPENLNEAHDYWEGKYKNKQEKERKIRERERYLSELEKVKENEENYRKSKEKYFNLEFKDNDITIKPLVSVSEFFNEGNNMHHCVYTCGYYKHEDALIMHALINGSSVATIEYNLNSMQIVQCRGVCNSVPKQKDRIISLINKNKNKIETIRLS